MEIYTLHRGSTPLFVSLPHDGTSIPDDVAGRMSGLASGGTAIASGVTYFPFGPAEAWTQGNGAGYSRSFDQDGRIAGIAFAGGTIALAYDAASRNEIPVIRIGRRLLVPRAALSRLLDEAERATDPDP